MSNSHEDHTSLAWLIFTLLADASKTLQVLCCVLQSYALRALIYFYRLWVKVLYRILLDRLYNLRPLAASINLSTLQKNKWKWYCNGQRQGPFADADTVSSFIMTGCTNVCFWHPSMFFQNEYLISGILDKLVRNMLTLYRKCGH